MIKTIKAKINQEKTDSYCAVIWNIHEMKVATKPIFWVLYKAGVTKVKHLLNPNSGNLQTYQEFVNHFKVKSSFIVFYGLLSAIKKEFEWKISPTGRQRQTRSQNWYDNEENLSNTALHKIIVEKNINHLPMKTELLFKEWILLKSKNYINGLFLVREIQSW